jgi:hypothetical protein
MTIQADRRMSRGVWFNINYTWAKGLTDTSYNNYPAGAQQNQYERFLERADDPSIRRQQLRFSYVLDVPIGRGHRVLGNIPRALDHVLGGWQFAGITTLLTGAALSPSYSNADPAFTNQFSGRPDRIGDGNFDSGIMRDSIKNRIPIFDASAFAVPATGRGSLRQLRPLRSHRPRPGCLERRHPQELAFRRRTRPVPVPLGNVQRLQPAQLQ